MNNKELKLKLQNLREQLEKIIEKIQTERQESKDDETNVIDELMMNKGLLEKEIENIEEALYEPKKLSQKKYVLKQNNVIRKISLVDETLADSSAGLISSQSPLGKALQKVRVGDKFKVFTPIGETEYLLLETE